LDATGVEAAASQLQYMDPNFYDSVIPAELQSNYPELTALYGGTRQTGSSVLPITSSDGTKFKHFAKDNTWGQDLYDDLVEPTLKLPFQWETWRRSPYLPSLCTTPYKTLNVDSVSLGSFQFSYTQDHSKWGVSLQSSWTCVGGINRMQSQRKRGGGTMCLSNSYLWKALSATVASTAPCSTMSALPPSNVDLPPPPGSGPSVVHESRTSSSQKPSGGKHKPSHRHTVRQGPAPRRHGAPHARHSRDAKAHPHSHGAETHHHSRPKFSRGGNAH